MTVRKQFLLTLAAFSIIPTLALTLTLLASNVKTIENIHIDRLKSITHTATTAFNEVVNLRRDEVRLLASSWAVRDYMRSREHGAANGRVTAETLSVLQGYFNTYIEVLGTFDDVVLLDPKGAVIAGYHPETVGRDLSEMDYFRRVRDNQEENYVYTSKVHESLTRPDNPDLKCLGLSIALRGADGQLTGVLVAYADANLLAGVARSISFGRTGVAFIIDADNFILYHPDPRFYNSYTSAAKITNMLARWKNKEIPLSGLIDDVMDGKRRIYSYEVLPNIEQVLFLRQDYDEFVADRNATLFFGAGVCGLAALLALLFGLWFSKRLVKPIMTLKGAFASGEKENSYVQIRLPRGNEFGDMAQSYNTMISRLESQYELLKTARDKSEHDALHDSVTGLLNRAAFEREISRKILQSAPFAVLYIDIDNFKHVNYVMGHIVGDDLLRALGERLARSKARFSLCARIGGDEFLLCRDGDADDARQAAGSLLEELRQPIELNGSTFFINISVGIALYPESGASSDSLIANADIAMFHEKQSNGNAFCLYTPDMRASLDRRNSILDALRGGTVERDVFFMYQPIIDWARNTRGFEILMRIRNERLGLISPAEFIPIAENDKGLMRKLDSLALEAACGFARRCAREKGFDGYVSVNISSAQLSKADFAADVLGHLQRAGLEGGSLRLEIAESSFADGAEKYFPKLEALRQAGVLVSLDGFSVKNSAFHHFVHLPVDVLKIDPSFFQAAETDARMEYVIRTVIDLARTFGRQIVAKCVETEAERELLKNIGCEYIQGFVYSKPLMSENALEKLDERVSAVQGNVD